jgi:hypothetical protein
MGLICTGVGVDIQGQEDKERRGMYISSIRVYMGSMNDANTLDSYMTVTLS